MARWLVLVLLLGLHGCCLCSGVQSSDARKNATAPAQQQPEGVSASAETSSMPSDRIVTSTGESDAANEAPSAATHPPPRPRSPASRVGNAHRIARNRAERTFSQEATRLVRVRGRGESAPRPEEGSVAKAERGTVEAEDSAAATASEGTPRKDESLPASAAEGSLERSTPTPNPLTANESGVAVQEAHGRSPCSSDCDAPHRSHPARHSSLLSKLVFRLSKPGAFEKGKSVFGDEAVAETTSCPPGDVGLSCRQSEAMRGAEECYGGNCEECRSCDETAVTEWPRCCRDNFRCCSQLALACQRCDKPALQLFCTKHFKRCS